MTWRFLLNPGLCIGCRSCEMACRNEFSTEGAEYWRRVKEINPPDGAFYFLSISCNHCENPECFRVCPERTYRKRKDGVVLHDPRRCSACGKCTRACPVKAPKVSLVSGKVDKCNFCVHRLENSQVPACVVACPMGALAILSPAEPDPEGVVNYVQGMGDVLITKPTTRFIVVRKPEV
ncbi:4Fe-4S dicluster domain-containing protein [Desulfitobacterium hafniense]|uniref:4Fe-4S dicluster domain-containing protein n=1 Tax=Desulfitobacterium hafniense TaxID=49338 RepID=UPI000363B42C|nr:4Fe-4S dicluster domain-containing protein [Desulfitobacterium hafniense]